MLHIGYLVTIVTSQRRYILMGKMLDFIQKIPVFKLLSNPQS